MDWKTLAERARSGDAAAWTELFKATQSMVYFTALKMTGNGSAAQDIAQESCLKAMESIHKLRVPEAFVNWMRQIAVNVCRNYLGAENMLVPLFNIQPKRGGLLHCHVRSK